ncbi:hypothetical protein SC09_contig4orf00269 [Bacillus subtilis]|uniref:Uncharacterized protein n=1 Tax=Bacillus subtilis TaxID=1423 RepID=A0A0D1KH18_BACIU|nr:hypothetical protein SC09_contig4orf00269 [Bacillus subtilis]
MFFDFLTFFILSIFIITIPDPCFQIYYMVFDTFYHFLSSFISL